MNILKTFLCSAYLGKKGTVKCVDKTVLVYERWVKASRMYEGKSEEELRHIPSVHKFSRRSTDEDYERAVLCENLSTLSLPCLHIDV